MTGVAVSGLTATEHVTFIVSPALTVVLLNVPVTVTASGVDAAADKPLIIDNAINDATTIAVVFLKNLFK